MPSTARQLRQPPTIEAIGRVPYFADVYLLYSKAAKGLSNPTTSAKYGTLPMASMVGS